MTWAALFLGVVGAMAAYGGSRHQRLWSSPLPRYWSIAGWAVSWGFAAVCLLAALGLLAAAFAIVVAGMLGLSASAFLGAALARGRRP